jgi:hypothetical protein
VLDCAYNNGGTISLWVAYITVTHSETIFRHSNFRFWQIVLQKSAALMGFSLGTSASFDADLGSARVSALLVLI